MTTSKPTIDEAFARERQYAEEWWTNHDAGMLAKAVENNQPEDTARDIANLLIRIEALKAENKLLRQLLGNGI